MKEWCFHTFAHPEWDLTGTMDQSAHQTGYRVEFWVVWGQSRQRCRQRSVWNVCQCEGHSNKPVSFTHSNQVTRPTQQLMCVMFPQIFTLVYRLIIWNCPFFNVLAPAYFGWTGMLVKIGILPLKPAWVNTTVLIYGTLIEQCVNIYTVHLQIL